MKQTMAECISVVAAEIAKDQAKKSIKKSIFVSLAKTLFVNAITMPFGRISIATSRYKSKSKQEIEKIFLAALYDSVLVGREPHIGEALVRIYDEMPHARKLGALSFAIDNPKGYKDVVEKTFQRLGFDGITIDEIKKRLG